LKENKKEIKIPEINEKLMKDKYRDLKNGVIVL
jgi:hypothetical protein